jgi:hypothetical protein
MIFNSIDPIYEYNQSQVMQADAYQTHIKVESEESHEQKYADLKSKSELSQNTYEMYKKEFEFEWNIGTQHACYDLFQPASEFDHFYIINTEMKMFD